MGWPKHTIRFFRFLLPISLLLFFFSLTRVGERRAPWYELALWNLISPVEHLFHGVGHGVTTVWKRYIALGGVRVENELLKKKIAELEGLKIDMDELRQTDERLRDLLGLEKIVSRDVIAALVVANDPRSEFKSVTINRGRDDGVELFMPVMGRRGVVGMIGKVSSHRAIVLLITDPNSSVDVMVQRSRVRALLVGTAQKTELRAGYYLSRLEYLHRTSDVQDGDIVVTSGFDHVYPPGLAVGTITNLSRHSLGVFEEAEVVPFENYSELQEVLVLKTPRLQPEP